MSLQNTPALGLPLLQAGQAQKHITLNESLWRLDALAQARVKSRVVGAQPATPQEGDAYILPAGASGVAWDDFDAGDFVVYQGGYWDLLSLPEGALVHVADEGGFVVRVSSGWVLLQATFNALQNLQRLGVGATADATNRLSVSSPQVLFNHAGGGSLLYGNKAAETDEAGLVFQTGFSSRALLGTLGSDNLTLKVSPDGAVFHTVLSVDRNTGHTTFHTHTRLRSFSIGTAWGGVYEPGCFYSDPNWGFLMRAAEPDPVADDFVLIDGYGNHLLRCGNGRGAVENALKPGFDNNKSLGTASLRWSQVFVASGTISTSDARLKAEVLSAPAILEAEARAASRIRGVLRTYQWLSAIAVKGEAGARWHFGVFAQEVRDILSEEGLEAARYGFFCADERYEEIFDPDTGARLEVIPAGTQLGVRYDELILFLLKYT